MYKQESIKALFPECVRQYFRNVIRDYDTINEVRVRRNGPVHIVKGKDNFYLTRDGFYTDIPSKGVCLTEQEFHHLFQHICRHSVYAFEEELCNGYLTVEGGHRVGVVGQTVWDGKEVRSLKYFSALNIRIAHEIKGVADPVIPYVYKNNILCSTLIVSPPGFGKTTLLRDMVRKISNGSKEHCPQNVSLIDERSEIASCYLGIAQNDVGMHTDILDACPKAAGMMLVLRTMSPDVIAVDELGGEEDYDAMRQAFYLGCKVIATMHGNGYEMLHKNPCMHMMLGQGGFERIVILEKQHRIQICDEKGELIQCF